MSSPLERRRAGVLLHPTSLPPGPAGGVLGDSALRFVDLIAEAGFSVWQMLPVGPVDASLSPYSSKSSFAGNPALLDRALIDGLQVGRETALEIRREAALDTAAVTAALGHEAFESFLASAGAWLLPWVDYALRRERYGRRPWWQWPDEAARSATPAVAGGDPWPTGAEAATALEADAILARARAEPRFGELIATQFLFDQQWQRLRRHAQARGVALFGDLPFYTDHDSADTWAERQVFALDAAGQPEAVAGVPPDYFSADGQLWGNPLFDWDGARPQVFDWWTRRLAVQLARFDLLRLDHFRALEAHWAVPAGAETAREGHWRPTPGHALLAHLRSTLGALPLVAEDLGTITPEVLALRDAFDLPGMLVLQFAFDGSPDNPYLPAQHVENAVVYTGTHDNDTTLGWYHALDEHTQGLVRGMLEPYQPPGAGVDVPMPETLIRCAYASPARLAIIPMQDLLGLGAEARMNLPGVAEGNWRWRFDWAQVERGFGARWRGLAEEFERR
ncbi:MAG: 4-alpha-glucanotransferase [Gammaproteobacteria bacterium]|nr:MAG: 4-alpha-glucanotransferase [Gammaproteobacteria bacterium]